MPDNSKLSPERKALADAYIQGRRLRETVDSAGWQDVLDFLEDMVVQSEYQLMSYNGTDGDHLLLLHRRARTYREVFDGLQKHVQTAIEAGQTVPEMVESGMPGLDI